LNSSRKIIVFQWAQLVALTGVHCIVDLFSAIPPPILPAIRAEFILSVESGVIILCVHLLACNSVQVLSGHMRSEKRRPLFMYIGLFMATAICLLAVLPREAGGFELMILLAVVSGSGIAIAHPEGLRGIHSLGQIPAATSTAVFMAGGFIGYAVGGWLPTILVSGFGLRGLYWLLLCPLVGVLLIVFLRIRLAVEPKTRGTNESQVKGKRPAFWPIMVMAVPAAVSTTIVASLMPTRLEELGFELTFGGFSAMMFGAGGALGSFVWAWVAHKKSELGCAIAGMVLSPVLLLLYLMLIGNRAAVWVFFGVGFNAISSYILMITMARGATGPNLGQRMGLIVGGSWAVANVVLMIVVHFFSVKALLKIAPIGYLISGIVGVFIMYRNTRAGTEELQ